MKKQVCAIHYWLLSECLVRKGINARTGTLNTFEHKELVEKMFVEIRFRGSNKTFWKTAKSVNYIVERMEA